ncbi:MAG: VPLPA-CTERM sorting domain-containing protein [Desulfamplus sp.]|nr:VPLPA-CTERM sorting domain-containing protein [Desulfamplus sp.]
MWNFCFIPNFDETISVHQILKAEQSNSWLDGDVTGEDEKEGEWDFGQAINFYTVKAGPGFQLFMVDPAASSGTWEITDDLTQGKMSHVSAWIYTAPNSVPIPASVFLLGSGILGIIGLGRNRKKHML